jgi:hypothetical protein
MTWLGLALLLGVGVVWAGEKKEPGTCSNHETAIDFFDTPSEAATAAKKQEKLVLVLHVSGNFEDPRLT